MTRTVEVPVILRQMDYDKDASYDADVVIVGTGAGGAVVGARLAEAGWNVLFVEEGGYFPTSSFNPYIGESINRMYRDAGATVILGTPPIPYAEGRCVGGSTVLNGGMTWRTPVRIHDTWEKEIGPELGYKAFESLYEEVEGVVHAKSQIPQSVGDDNRIMVQGAKKMGWKVDINHRNQEACVGANNCILGCPTGAKQSTLVSWMPRAIGAGARCLTEVRVKKLLFKGGRAVGVEGRAVDPRTRRPAQRIKVRAKVVVVACGAVHSAHLLRGHRGLGRPSGQLGKNFTCHPNGKVVAVYPFDVKGWQGVSQYSKIMEFHDEGIMIAENFIPAGVMAAHLHNHGHEAWALMERYNSMVCSGFMLEDTIRGEVKRGPFDMPLARYDLGPIDHQRFLRAAKLLAEMHFAMGAEKVLIPFTNLLEISSPDELKKITIQDMDLKTLLLFTVHVMGTASMGSDERRSVVNLKGQMWDVPGCYIADASLLPSAPAVNPQVTIMAFADKVAAGILETEAKVAEV